MKIRVFADRTALACAAATHVADAIRSAIAEKGTARILAATGESQIGLLDALTREPGIAWGEVDLFHVAEHVGIGVEHPASTRRFLFERLIHKTRPGRYHLLGGEHDPEQTCGQEGEHLRAGTVDVAFIGLGENGRLAFNDPPADFATEKPYLMVRTDETWRRRQVEAGLFATLADAPERTITISIRQLLKAKAVLCVAPGPRKAEAVKRCVEGAVSPFAPASILRTHPDATLFLDQESAALLRQQPECES